MLLGGGCARGRGRGPIGVEGHVNHHCPLAGAAGQAVVLAAYAAAGMRGPTRRGRLARVQPQFRLGP